jgi:hypothetical protein
MIVEHCWNDTDTGKTEVLERKRALLPLYPPQILHEVPWDRTPFSEMRCRRLTALYKMFHCILNIFFGMENRRPALSSNTVIITLFGKHWVANCLT